jgi:DNA-binding PadR family transcriptional regulator
MEKTGLLVSQIEAENGRKRRIYEATQSGKDALQLGKDRVRELYRELLEEKH